MSKLLFLASLKKRFYHLMFDSIDLMRRELAISREKERGDQSRERKMGWNRGEEEGERRLKHL